MLEINDLYAFEGLPESQKKEKEKILEEGEENEEDDNIFVHEHDELQKSMIDKPNYNKTIIVPKSRLTIQDSSNKKLKRMEKTVPEQEYEVFNLDDFEDLNEPDEPKNSFLDYHQLLNLEDPFMRVSRPSHFNYRRVSAFEKRANRNKKKKNDYLFKKNPKFAKSDKNLNKFAPSIKIEEENTFEKSNNIEEKDEENDENEDKNDKRESLLIKEKTKDENKIKKEDLDYIDVVRTSFVSRESIDLEETTFEIEVVDSVAMTILQVINCMIKANLVQIAISMKELGLIWGPITICSIAIMSLISLNLILEVNKITGFRSYLLFSEIIFGHFGSVIILICQFMSAFGGCLSFIVIFNKVVPKLLNFSLSQDWLSDEKIFTTMLGFFLFFFCYKQDVNIIKSAAKYAVFAVLSFFGVTIIDFVYTVLSQDKLIKLDDEWNNEKKDEILFGLNNSKYPFSERLSNIITAVACIILSYSFHIFTFSIYGCMGKISRKQFFITTSVSVLITTIIYLICGTIGYLLYYDYLTDSILDAVQESWLSSLLSLANVVNVIMTFPITFSAVKNYFILFVGIMITLLKDLFIWIFSFIPTVNRIRSRSSTNRKSKIFKHGYLMTGKQLVHIPDYIQFFLTVLIYFLVFLFASMYTKLKVIFSLTGGVMGNILSFIFPSIFYLYFFRKKGFTKYAFVAVVFIIFGIATMSICIMSTIQSL
jgi:amino acid permease